MSCYIVGRENVISEGRKRFEFLLNIIATDSFINMDQDLFETTKNLSIGKKSNLKKGCSHTNKFHFSVSLNILEKCMNQNGAIIFVANYNKVLSVCDLLFYSTSFGFTRP